MVYRFSSYAGISSSRNVLIDQRESSCCTLSDGKPNNNIYKVRHRSAPIFNNLLFWRPMFSLSPNDCYLFITRRFGTLPRNSLIDQDLSLYATIPPYQTPFLLPDPTNLRSVVLWSRRSRIEESARILAVLDIDG